jgi:hypothetical protein
VSVNVDIEPVKNPTSSARRSLERRRPALGSADLIVDADGRPELVNAEGGHWRRGVTIRKDTP